MELSEIRTILDFKVVRETMAPQITKIINSMFDCIVAILNLFAKFCTGDFDFTKKSHSC